MATYKVYRKGNFLEVIDLDNGQVWNAPVYDAFIEKLHDPLQYRYRFHFSDGKFLDRILLEEIVDENSAPYTAQSFDTFRTCKLGYVPIGFGCGESINIPQDFLDLTDTPASYSGAANQYVRVNATATGLEFFALDLSIYAETADLGAVAFSNDYNDLDNLPVVSSTNIYNADDALTGNRTVTMGSYTLTFSGNTVKTISPSASALDTAFGVRNNTDTSYHFYVRGDGRVIASGNVFEATQGINVSGSGIINFGASNFIIQGGSGVVDIQSYNGNAIKFNQLGNDVWLTPYAKFIGNGRVQLTNLPTSSVGLSTGDVWNDGGTLKIV